MNWRRFKKALGSNWILWLEREINALRGVAVQKTWQTKNGNIYTNKHDMFLCSWLREICGILEVMRCAVCTTKAPENKKREKSISYRCIGRRWNIFLLVFYANVKRELTILITRRGCVRAPGFIWSLRQWFQLSVVCEVKYANVDFIEVTCGVCVAEVKNRCVAITIFCRLWRGDQQDTKIFRRLLLIKSIFLQQTGRSD